MHALSWSSDGRPRARADPPSRPRARPSRDADRPRDSHAPTPGAPVDRARASPGREPPFGRIPVPRGTRRVLVVRKKRLLLAGGRAPTPARRRAPFDHPRAGKAGRYAVAGGARVPERGDVHGSERARAGQGRVRPEDPVPVRRGAGRRGRVRLDARRRVRASVPDAQAHGPVPRRQDHAFVGGPQPAVVAAEDQARVWRAGAAGAPDDDGQHLVPGESRGRAGLKRQKRSAVAGGRGGGGPVRRARGGCVENRDGSDANVRRDERDERRFVARKKKKRVTQANGKDGAAPGAVRG